MYPRMLWTLLIAAAALVVDAHELDPAACAARFDVQRDKIIRTEESREMGARYLSELDVGARRECLRLCCETDACDVFVFEEKSPGSCYLFNCGPPEDFRCKFTAHGNFSSGVLALSRRLAELQDQERLEHHERELASLRHPTTTTMSTTQTTRSTELPRLPPEPPQPPQEPPPPQPLPRRCSRYQFECRRGGECIAVYNACDGVPQCADGSDEAPELGCPASPAPAVPPEHSPARVSPATHPPVPSLPLTQVQVLDSVEDGRSAVGPVSNNDAMAEGPDIWPHRLTQAQPQHRYNSAGSGGSMGGSHIFSHKGGLLQENAFEPPAPNAPWPRRAWQAPQTGADGMDGDRGWGGYGRLDWPDTEPRRAWPVPPRPEPDIPVYLPPKTMPEMPMIYSSQRQTLRDSPKKGFDLINQNQPIDFQTEPPPPPRPPVVPLVDDSIDRREEQKPPSVENTTKKKVLKDIPLESGKSSNAGVHAGAVPHTAAVAALEARERWPLDEHDGLSEHPPAAVLLLVLGTLMTAALGGMLACRARAARRRRRAHPRLALDADYLVNGMYL
ncbi:uncharacterized protein LOC125066199 isoform X2 [Vanessa atalanta]|uniref:uncharacterized protein LOC125066199 isoform X2 n=1 Tax=Vanessa atalanta TaxID=42275 RepID=UPI001FCE01F5|nr:uncharacterized protein LOC125066199 isoform X2 [Vanessa atalanta]